MTAPRNFLGTEGFPLPDLLEKATHVWDLLKTLGPWCKTHVKKTRIQGRVSRSAVIEGLVIIGKGTVVEAGAYLRGPIMIGRDCDIRHNAYLRGEVVVGDGSVIGNSCELKHTICGAEVQVPHLAYVGDTVLGRKVHLGAGVIVSNVKLNRGNIQVTVDGAAYDTQLKKFGAVVGDLTEVGCNCVLNPGTLLGPECLMYPNVSWSGFLPARHIVKYRPEYQVIPRRSII